MVHTVDGEVKDTQVTHSHDDTVKDVQAHLLRERCKSQTSLTSRPEAVICKELAKLPNTSSIDKYLFINCLLNSYLLCFNRVLQLMILAFSLS